MCGCGQPHNGQAAVARRWYHASPHEFRPGELVEPGHPAHYLPRPERHVYFSDSPGRSRYWADDIENEPGLAARIYAVRPMGEVRPDPYDEDAKGDYRSAQPLEFLLADPFLEAGEPHQRHFPFGGDHGFFIGQVYVAGPPPWP